jgi:hypothetical protein
MLRIAVLAAFLATGATAAQAEAIRLDDAQLDAVSAGFLNFAEFRALLAKGLANPETLNASFGRDLLRALFSRSGGIPVQPPYTNGGHGAVPD